MPFGLTPAELAQLAISGGAGLAGAIASGNQRNLTTQQQQLQNRLLALQNQQQVESDLANQRQSRAVGFADRMPLGSEQQYALQQAARAALLPVLQQRQMSGPTDPAIRATFTQQTNPLNGVDMARILQTLSPDATARALTDRRTALAAVDPSGAAQLRPLSDYGLDPTGEFNKETQYRTNQVQGQLDQEAQTLRQLAMQQYNLTEQQAQDLEKKGGGGGFWKTLGRIGLIAGGAIATGLTAGSASPLLAAAIGAGTGAGSAALSGQGLGGILAGAGLGAATGGFGGSGATAGTSAAQRIKDAILNPRTLTQMAGAGVGGPIGQGIQAGSMLLPNTPFGGRPAQVRQDTASAGDQGPQLPRQGGELNIPLNPRSNQGGVYGGVQQSGIPQNTPPRPARPMWQGPIQPNGGASGQWDAHQPQPVFNVERPNFSNNYGVTDSRGFTPFGAGQPPPTGSPAIPWWLMPTGLGSNVLQGEVVDKIPALLRNITPRRPQLMDSINVPLIGSGSKGIGSIGNAPLTPQLPGGNMAQWALPPAPAPQASTVLQQLQRLLAQLPDGQARTNVMRQIAQMLGAQ